MSMLDRRRFIERSTLLAVAAYVGGASAPGRASAQQVPRSSFAADATAEQVTEGIDLTVKTIVVTGCN